MVIQNDKCRRPLTSGADLEHIFVKHCVPKFSVVRCVGAAEFVVYVSCVLLRICDIPWFESVLIVCHGLLRTSDLCFQ